MKTDADAYEFTPTSKDLEKQQPQPNLETRAEAKHSNTRQQRSMPKWLQNTRPSASAVEPSPLQLQRSLACVTGCGSCWAFGDIMESDGSGPMSRIESDGVFQSALYTISSSLDVHSTYIGHLP